MAYMHIIREMHKYTTIDIPSMDGYEQEIELIKKVLEENPKGMTVSDISRKIKINRNSVAKYLDIMRISGYVEMITFGPAKVFFPSKRVPISDMLNYTSDYIIVFDADLRITLINKSFCSFLKIQKENIIGETIKEVITNIFEEKSELIIAINEALDGKSYKQEIDLSDKNESYFFLIKIVPTTFEDGRTGGTLIIKNITYHKIAESVLRESEEKFKSLIKKLDKK